MAFDHSNGLRLVFVKGPVAWDDLHVTLLTALGPHKLGKASSQVRTTQMLLLLCVYCQLQSKLMLPCLLVKYTLLVDFYTSTNDSHDAIITTTNIPPRSSTTLQSLAQRNLAGILIEIANNVTSPAPAHHPVAGHTIMLSSHKPQNQQRAVFKREESIHKDSHRQ